MINGIAISGKIAAGKTTLAHALSEHYKWPVRSLAQPLKQEVVEALLNAGLYNNGEWSKDLLRPLFQGWGTIFREVNDTNWWIDKLLAANPEPIIVDDLRYRNELEALKAAGFLIVRININPAEQGRRIRALYPDMKDEALSHISETDLDNWQYYDRDKFDVIVQATHTTEFQIQTINHSVNLRENVELV